MNRSACVMAWASIFMTAWMSSVFTRILTIGFDKCPTIKMREALLFHKARPHFFKFRHKLQSMLFSVAL